MDCDRCRAPTTLSRCSWFNMETLCPSCQAEEEAHPRFAEAKEAEAAAVRAGDFNFPGIGWPLDNHNPSPSGPQAPRGGG